MSLSVSPACLKHRVILITGSSDGLGREAALSYARYGASVILLGRNEKKLSLLAQQIETEHAVSVHYYVLDLALASAEQCQQLAQTIARHSPVLNGVLHSASILGAISPMSEQSPAEWQQVMQVNVNAAFFLTQALLPLLLKAPSASLIFTSSSVGRHGRANWGAYAVSKFATEGMMQVLADEYRHSTLRVNCINPGGTRTKMRASAFPQEDPATLKTPAELMPLWLWLMSDESLSQTGHSFDAQPHRQPGASS